MKFLALPGSGSSSAARGPSSSILWPAAPGEPGLGGASRWDALERRGHGGAGGLGAAASRLQRRGAMAGRATASPPAGPGPPPSSCPAVCGLRSSSSPCLRGPEPRAGRRRRGGPRCRCWPPPAGRAALSGCACVLCSPTSARGWGEDAARRPGDGRRRRMLPRRPRRAERSAQLDPSLQLQVPAPPPPAANGGSPAAPQRLAIGYCQCPSGATAGRAARSPAALDGAHPPGHPVPCGDTAERWRPARAESPGGTPQHRERGKPGQTRGRDAAGIDRPALSLLPEGRAPAERGRKGRSAGRAAGAGMGPPERCLSLAPDARPAAGPRACLLPRPPSLRAETPLLGSVPVGHPRCSPVPSPRLLQRGHPGPSRSPPGWLSTRARPAARRGARPRAGEGDPSPPDPREQPVPTVPPARRTRPELPLPVRVPAAAGAGPDERQRPGDRRGTPAPSEGHGPLRPPGHCRARPSCSGTRVKDFLPAPRILTSPG